MRLLIFTDIDGSLIDFDSYRPGPALLALEACRRRDVPVILCTSKPFIEVLDLRRTLGLDTPFIVENGAAIFMPVATAVAAAALRLSEDEGWDSSPVETEDGPTLVCLKFGISRSLVVDALEDIARETDIAVRGISEMTVSEISVYTGLPPDQARAAQLREFSEPFIILKGPPDIGEKDRIELLEIIRPAAEKRGFSCLLGGRFFHLQGEHSKGTAVAYAVRCYSEAVSADIGFDSSAGRRSFTTMALGDALNDVDMLAAVDDPVLIRRPDGTYAEGLTLTRFVRTEGIGPEGWYEAVTRALEGLSRSDD